jgi:aspartate dehydrogenase
MRLKPATSGRRVNIGIVGCGAIGTELAQAAQSLDDIESVVLFDIDPDAIGVSATLAKCRVAESPEALIAAADLVVECANKGVVQTSILLALEQGKSAMILTVGAMADEALAAKLTAAARAHGGKLYIPSGAIMGIDGLKAAAVAGIQSVTLVTTKPSAGLDRDVDQWTLLFNGSAREAVAAFPKNINVAATLSLAGLGFDKTWVQVAVDPLATRNSHKVIIDGDFGRARIEVENLPSPTNPRTSHLASLSAIALLQRIVSPIQIGA